MYSLQESESPRELLGWLEDPLVLELTVLVAFAAAFVWMLLRIRYSLGKLSGRKLLRAYLEGVEARLAGDPEAARKLLVPVVEADPENTGARLALGDAFYLLDEPSAAHAHHMEAREVFAAGGPMVDLALAKDLHAAGELADAVEVIDRALAAEPRNEEILEQAWSIKEEAGLFGEALRAGRSLFGRRKAASIGRRLALTAARAGMHCLSREDRERARAYFKESLGLDPGNVLAQRGSLLVGKQPAAGLLLGESESQLLPALRSSGGFLALFPEALCAACGSPRQPDGDAACCACGSAKAPVYAETSMGEAIPSPDELYDEIEENDAWFERLARRLSTGDRSAGPELLEGGDRGIFSLLTIAVGVGDPHGLLSQLLVELGARHPETLLHVRQRINERSRRVLQRMRGTRKCDELLGPVLRRLGPEPMGFFQRLLSQPDTLADRGLRGLIIDYFVGCGDIQAFEGLARRFSPVEIVRHMNRRIPAEELGQLFARMPEESSFLRDAILADPALDRPEAFARALALCREKDVQRFEKLFEERGADPRLISELVLLLNGPGDANRRAEQVLARFLPTAIDYLVASYADPETPAHALEAIRRLLRGQGADAVGELVRCLGSNPAEVDDRVILALVDLGEGALEEIESSYRQQMGWLGKLGLLHGRHPRSCLIRAVASIPGARAFGVLQRLLTSETDAELRSILREALRQSRGKETE